MSVAAMRESRRTPAAPIEKVEVQRHDLAAAYGVN